MSEHGSLKSYIFGFFLSLVFTAIPYYLVVNKSVTGTTLLATILGFAVLQMAVQIFFFLHLGRGPKPLYNITFFVFTVGTILVVVLGSIFIMNNLRYAMSPTAAQVTKKLSQDEGISQVNGVQTGACQEIKASHIVTFKDGKVSPQSTQAKLCDTLTFVNEDTVVRDVAFGPHPHHEIYGGVEELSVQKKYPKTLTLNQAGTYTFHDHLDDSVAGTFTVTP